MTSDEIKKYTDEMISVEKIQITELDEGGCFTLELVTSSQDLPVKITAPDGGEIQINHRDIPQFVRALTLICNEHYL